jgi:dihydroorotase
MLQNLTENDKIDRKKIWEVKNMTILLKNGNVIDYASRANKKMDILIEDRKIIKVADQINEGADKTIDCTGLMVIPGMIDMHCHLRQPGFEYKETIETGSKSAVKGGFTTICPMPNTKPTPDSAFVLEEILKEANRVNLCNIFPYSSVTKGEKGEELVNFEEMKNAGAIAFSDDGMPVVNARIMREAMIKANEQGTFVASHCEEKSVSAGAINAGPIAEKLGVEGVLPEAEEIMAAREIVISETNKIRGHICHISTKTSVDMIRDAKKRGVKITCETCPHYFSLTVKEVLESGTNAKMNPPLREEEDRQAIIKGLQDGTIDAIITDHAPHSEEEKQKPLSQAPNGIIGFETALAASITYLIETKCISYLDLVRLTSYTPAQLLNLKTKGMLKEGYDADITIFDPNIEYVYSKESIVSKSKNTPFIGKTLKGKVMYTIVGGKIVYEK